MSDQNPRPVGIVEVDGETFSVEEARALLSTLVDAAEDLERDREGTVVLHDDLGRHLFGGVALTATQCRQLIDRLTSAATEADAANRPDPGSR